VVSVTDGVASEPEFVPLDRVRFVDVEVDLGDHPDVASLLDALEAAADPARHDDRSLVVRATVVGAGPLHDELAPAGRRAEVLDDLRRRGVARQPFAWWQSIGWSTRAALDVVDLRQRGDFAADLLRTIDETPPDRRRDWADLLPAEVARELDALLPEGTDAIWDEAAQLALDAVAGADA
ncbi:MAG: hypothetical protein KDB33_19150, partial [Acidimicrobiales bacterium]|nr:hypothetical protein [Acidimicrobiales bacterium]